MSKLTINHGVHSTIGCRSTQEDDWMTETFQIGDSHYTCYTIMDGHSGRAAVDFTKQNFHQYLHDELKIHNKPVSLALDATFRRIDVDFLTNWSTSHEQEIHNEKNKSLCGASHRSVPHAGADAYPSSPGTTIVNLVLVQSSVSSTNKWYLTWVGDSRAYVIDLINGHLIDQTSDHDPNSPEELKRIESAGGHVEFNRVNGFLAMSRAIGDFQFKQRNINDPTKQMVSCVPSIKSNDITKELTIVLATDGIYNSWGTHYENIARDVVNKLKEKKNEKLMDVLSNVAQEMVSDATNRGSTDNITAIIIQIIPK